MLEIRSKETIDKDRQSLKNSLEDVLTESIQVQESYNVEIKTLQNTLKKLEDETCFENTLAGKTQELERMADFEIRLILSKLSHQTGHKYEVFSKPEKGETNDK